MVKDKATILLKMHKPIRAYHMRFLTPFSCALCELESHIIIKAVYFHAKQQEHLALR